MIKNNRRCSEISGFVSLSAEELMPYVRALFAYCKADKQFREMEQKTSLTKTFASLQMRITFLRVFQEEREQIIQRELFAYHVLFSANASTEIRGRFLRYVNSFTKGEQREMRSLNPGLIKAENRYKKGSLSHISLLFREHMLLEKLNIVRSLLRCGLSVKEVLIVAKPDRPLNKDRVIATFERMGIKVLDDDRNFKASCAWAASRSNPVVVLDDGGELISACADYFPIRKKWWAIETTTKGSRIIRRRKIKKCTDISDSPTKRTKALDIAVSCVTAFRNLNGFRKLIGETVVLIGYGAIGYHVARIMRAMGIIIYIVDVDEGRRLLAMQNDFLCFSSLEEAARKSRGIKYVLGCSGAQSVNLQALPFLRRNAVLGSVSSQDLLLLKGFLEKNAAKRMPTRDGTTYSIGGKKITILADGHAVNIFKSEGVPEHEFDDVSVEIFETICQVARQFI